jgi:hypothetical protein
MAMKLHKTFALLGALTLIAGIGAWLMWRPSLTTPSATAAPIKPTTVNPDSTSAKPMLSTPEKPATVSVAKPTATASTSGQTSTPIRSMQPLPTVISLDSLTNYLDNPNNNLLSQLDLLPEDQFAGLTEMRYEQLASNKAPSLGLNRILLAYEFGCMRKADCANRSKIVLEQGMPKRFWPMLEAGNFDAVMMSMYLDSTDLPIGDNTPEAND